MPDEAEYALLAIAQPITWVEYPSKEHTGYRGYWRRAEGKSERASYSVSQRAETTHVDESPVQRAFVVSIRELDSGRYERADVPSLERAKDICLRHAITGNLSEIRTTDGVVYAPEARFVESEQAAYAALKNAFEQHKPRWLAWTPDDPDAWEFSTTASHGTYRICFDRNQRWMVTCTRPDRPADEHRCLMGTLAKMACSLHAHTGKWLGILDL